MPEIWLKADGTPNVAESAVVVGSGQVLADDDPTTHIHFTNPSSRGTFVVGFEDLPADWETTSKRNIQTWIAAKQSSTAPLVYASLFLTGFGPLTTTAEPAVIDRVEGDWTIYEAILTNPAWGEDTTLNTASVDGGGGEGGPEYLYELAVIVSWDVIGPAPPARLFPREDGLGVGSGRIYPPSKSQQRSSRRFGYY